MIMAGLEFMKKIPFKEVNIHGVVLDEKARKMSKSLGNGIDPLEVVKNYGADALRYTMIAITPAGQNLLLSMDKFSIGKHFANKIFNASRYVLINYSQEEIIKDISKIELNFADKWILSKLNKMIDQINKTIENYRFQDYAMIFNDFFWHQFCDWYLEISKIGLYKSDAKTKQKTLSILFYVLLNALKSFHPVMPFITEEVYQALPNKDNGSIMIAGFPKVEEKYIDSMIESDMEILKRVITSIRNIRSLSNIKPTQKINVKLKISEKEKIMLIKEKEDIIKFLANIETIEILDASIIKTQHVSKAAVNVTDNIEIFVLLEGVINIEEEEARLENTIKKLKLELQQAEAKISNENFMNRANQDAIDKVKEKQKSLTEDIALLERNLALLN